MIKQPSHLKKGDKIAIVCPASRLPKSIDPAISIFKGWGLEIVLGQTVPAEYHQYAGKDELRAADLQTFLDDPSIKAIVSGRGGYGVIRIIDDLDFSAFAENPKWIVGFSDITVLLSHLFSQLDVASLHAQMPYTFDDATPESLESLKAALFGEEISYQIESIFENRSGQAEGILIGGNLTLLVMLQGSVSEMDYTDAVLFIEDVGERGASIDRLMRMLKRAGKLKSLKGLIVGAFNELPDEKIPYGQSPEEIIWDIVSEYDFPVCFNFPTGHIDDNRTMIMGRNVALNVEGQQVELKFN